MEEAPRKGKTTPPSPEELCLFLNKNCQKGNILRVYVFKGPKFYHMELTPSNVWAPNPYPAHPCSGLHTCHSKCQAPLFPLLEGRAGRKFPTPHHVPVITASSGSPSPDPWALSGLCSPWPPSWLLPNYIKPWGQFPSIHLCSSWRPGAAPRRPEAQESRVFICGCASVTELWDPETVARVWHKDTGSVFLPIPPQCRPGRVQTTVWFSSCPLMGHEG